MMRWWRRPSLWIGFISIIAYWDDEALHGSYVYDDAGSIRNHGVVQGQQPWTEAWTRDFWGTPMQEAQSHKSFRPLTTLSFRWNRILSERYKTHGTLDETYGFHVVNVLLHGLVSALVTETAGWVFFYDPPSGDPVGPIITGLLFALHPVHAEAVSNMTSRGELLMSLFYLLAFLSYARSIHPTPPQSSLSSFTPTTRSSAGNTKTSFRHRLVAGMASLSTLMGIYVIPWLGMTMSMFCKEQGATALITLVVYDFVHYHSSLVEFGRQLWGQNRSSSSSSSSILESPSRSACIAFLRRTIVLAIQTLLVVAWRYWLNGETSPDFIYDQNPAGFSSDRFTRAFSVSWVYCLYVVDAFYPRHLCPDWSGKSIDLIDDWRDWRVVPVLALWALAAAVLLSLILGPPAGAGTHYRRTRRVILLALVAFLLVPFLLSSNILIVVGLMKADRVIYLPLLGFCLLEAYLFQILFCSRSSSPQTSSQIKWTLPYSNVNVVGYLLILAQLHLLTAKLHERNVAWSSSLSLWMAAYRINPRSHHTMYNCGYELSLKQRYAEAEHVLRPIASARVDGPTNSFVYSMVLYNLKRCEEAHGYIDEAMKVIEEKRANAGIRDTDKSLNRAESNLLVARAYCTSDIYKSGAIMYSAVEKDPTNQYAVDQATALLKRLEAAKLLQGGAR